MCGKWQFQPAPLFLSWVCKPSEGKLGGGGVSSSSPAGSPPPPARRKGSTLQAKANCYQLWSSATHRNKQNTTSQWLCSRRVSSTPGLLIRTEGGPWEPLSSLHTDAGVCSQSFSPPTGGLLFFLLAVYGTTECDRQRSGHQDYIVLTEMCKVC